jgi:hypothetical protein
MIGIRQNATKIPLIPGHIEISLKYLSQVKACYYKKKESIMDKAFDMVSNFLGRITDAGVKLIAVGVVLQILFGAAVPFLGVDVVAGVVKLVTALGSQGLVGLVAVAVLYWAFNKK